MRTIYMQFTTGVRQRTLKFVPAARIVRVVIGTWDLAGVCSRLRQRASLVLCLEQVDSPPEAGARGFVG